jgi:cell division protein FtsI/penicillin-binding protein 2
VRNADRKSLGDLTVKDVIARSRNVATAKIARMLAPNSTQKAAHRLYDLWQKVGMTRPTGADIANEITGNWYDPDVRQWSPIDLANRAFGQGVAVTMPQLARGTATLVNGGYLVQPHLVKGSVVGDEKERVLKAKVARQAKDIMTHVTGSLSWYAAGSLIPGYEIGGKTGTAQIWDSAKGKWKERRFNHNFIGFVGGRKQEYVVIVRLEEPKPIHVKQGDIPLRIESYELFQMVARSTINQLNMKKSKDPNAGRPIIGSDAAKRLEPMRNRQVQQAQKKAKAAAARKAKAAATKSSKDSEKATATGTSQRAGGAGSGGT